jgi:hypothetical protein
LDRLEGKRGRASGDKEEHDALKGERERERERDEVVAGARVVTGERLGEGLGAPREGERE